jgi:hypothetical protein
MNVTTRFSVPGREETDLFPLQNIKTSSGTYIAPCSMDAGDLSLGIKRPECEAGFKMRGTIHLLPVSLSGISRNRLFFSFRYNIL